MYKIAFNDLKECGMKSYPHFLRQWAVRLKWEKDFAAGAT